MHTKCTLSTFPSMFFYKDISTFTLGLFTKFSSSESDFFSFSFGYQSVNHLSLKSIEIFDFCGGHLIDWNLFSFNFELLSWLTMALQIASKNYTRLVNVCPIIHQVSLKRINFFWLNFLKLLTIFFCSFLF